MSNRFSIKWLTGVLSRGNPPACAAQSEFLGHLDYVERFGQELYATGWAWDPSRPATPITLQLVNGDQILSTVLADKRRIDLVQKGKGDGQHAFKRVHIGHGLTAEEIRTLRILPTGERELIRQGDCAFVDGAVQAFEGRIDTLEIFGPTARVMGWLWDLKQPETRMDARILLEDQLLATVTADEFRKDLREAGKGDGCHGFTTFIDLPMTTAEAGQLTLSAADTGFRVRQQNPCKTVVYAEDDSAVTRILLDEANKCIRYNNIGSSVALFQKLLLLRPENREARTRLLDVLGYQRHLATAGGLDGYRQDLKLFTLLLAELDQQCNREALR